MWGGRSSNALARLRSTATGNGAALIGNAVQIVNDKATAAAIAPTTSRNLWIKGTDGGMFYAVTGAAPGTYTSDGGTACGTEIANADGSAAWLRVRPTGCWDIEWFQTAQLAVDAVTTGGTLFINTASQSLDGVTCSLPIRIVGLGREQCDVTGSISIAAAGAGICFEDIDFSAPSGTALFAITGAGRPDFKRCTLNAGAGKFIFSWDHSGTAPQSIELIQTYVRGGKLLNAVGAGVTYSVHAKEACLVDITEDDWLTATASNYAEFLAYHSLINCSGAVTRVATDQRGVLKLRHCDLDDASAGTLLTNGAAAYDTLDVSICTAMTSGGSRRASIRQIYEGSGITAVDGVSAAVTTGNVTLNADLGIDEYIITGDATLTGNVVYAISGGRYEGQSLTVIFTGTHTAVGTGFSVNYFGLSSGTSATVGPHVVELRYVQGSWVVFGYGAARLWWNEAVTQPANADTAGLTVAQLENEVNELKAALRNVSILAS